LLDVTHSFESSGGAAPRLSFGSSGNFYRQIRQGAPFELFLSADEHYVHELVRAGRTLGEGATYAVGRLVVLAANESPLAADPTLEALGDSVGAGRLRRLAIANSKPDSDRQVNVCPNLRNLLRHFAQVKGLGTSYAFQ